MFYFKLKIKQIYHLSFAIKVKTSELKVKLENISPQIYSKNKFRGDLWLIVAKKSEKSQGLAFNQLHHLGVIRLSAYIQF